MTCHSPEAVAVVTRTVLLLGVTLRGCQVAAPSPDAKNDTVPEKAELPMVNVAPPKPVVEMVRAEVELDDGPGLIGQAAAAAVREPVMNP